MKLADRAKAFEESSRFSGGDRLGFKVPLGDIAELPGRYDPHDYLEKLGVKQAKRALVLGPGNGGMIGALLNLGCEEIVAIEPRHTYRDSLAGTVNLLKEVHQTAKIRTLSVWLNEHHLDTLGKFDLILWVDGFADCQTPLVTLRAIFKLVKGRPKGRAFIEVWHGNQDHIPEGQANATKPSVKGWDRTVKKLLGDDADFQKLGPQRTQNHAIYAFNYHRDVKGRAAEPLPEVSGTDPQHMAPLDPPKRDPRRTFKQPDGADKPENIQVDPAKVKAEREAKRAKEAEAKAKAEAEADAKARAAAKKEAAKKEAAKKEAAKKEAEKAKKAKAAEEKKAEDAPKTADSKDLPKGEEG